MLWGYGDGSWGLGSGRYSFTSAMDPGRTWSASEFGNEGRGVAEDLTTAIISYSIFI